MSAPARLMWEAPAGYIYEAKRAHQKQDKPLLVLDLTPAANEARELAVAKVLFVYDGHPKEVEWDDVQVYCLQDARAVLSALHPRLVNKEKTL